MKGLGRLGGIGTVWLAVALAATLGSMALAVRGPGPRALGLEAAVGGGASYLEPGGSSRFAPLSPAILSDLFGAGSLARLLGPSGPAGTGALGADATSPGHPAGDGPSDDPSSGPLPEEITRRLPSDSDLRVFMTADRSSASPGEEILYTITVRNVGKKDFRGDFHVEAHIPFGTTWAGNETRCRTAESCVIQEFPSPGLPVDELHLVQWGYSGYPIRAGQEEVAGYRVRVNPGTRPGTLITNDAHLTVTAPNPKPRMTTDPVVVRVR